jgi:hypothetical protein
MEADRMEILNTPFWVFYVGENVNLDSDKAGKWMYFFNDKEFAAKMCSEAVLGKVVSESKHSNADEGVCCFYLNSDDEEAHKRILTFFIDNRLIQKTKTGRLYNITFKLDNQTLAGEYGKKYTSDIKLSNFVDLNTGEWLV